MKTWVKLHTKINHDSKMGTLTWAERGIWSALLALAGEIDDQDEDGPTGLLDTIDNVAWRLRCDIDELEAALHSFIQRGMVDVDIDRQVTLIHFGRQQAAEGRSRARHAKWRSGVFGRDDYTCQECGSHGGRLNAHHVRPWFLCEGGRYDVGNGITLCRKCHRQRHRKGWKQEAIDANA